MLKNLKDFSFLHFKIHMKSEANQRRIKSWGEVVYALAELVRSILVDINEYVYGIQYKFHKFQFSI